jgi:hypothetical protein
MPRVDEQTRRRRRMLLLDDTLPYIDLILASAPLRYWPLDDAAGASSARELVAGDSGSPSNVTFGAAGNPVLGGLAASFNGTTSNINIAAGSLPAAFNDDLYTFVAWAQVASVGVWTDGNAGHVMNVNQNASNRSQMGRSTTNGLFTWDHAGNGVLDRVSESSLAVVTWMFLCSTYSTADNVHRAYRDGVERGTADVAVNAWTGTMAAGQIGRGQSASTFWNGFISHVAIYNRVLTASEIASLYVV